VRRRSRGSRRNEAAAPFEVALGRERCRERFVRVRRPMFDRVFLRGDCVVALPRRGTKTASAVAFELASGREVEIATLAAAGSGDAVRLDYLSSPVGRGPSQLRLFAGSAGEPWRTIELPDAVSGVAEAPFGWYVGAGTAFCTGSSARASWRGAGRRRGLLPSGPRTRRRSTFAPRPTGWPRTGRRRLLPGSAACGRSVRTG
jgi:hypothetical protein